MDHIKPVSKYPELARDLNNLQVLCEDCNVSKGNQHEDDLKAVDDG
ncbi:MAG: HNH endonuclease [Proteobacteria bacterium]|nr:HNH endonuclease [Pseudomonadota bacterium]